MSKLKSQTQANLTCHAGIIGKIFEKKD